MKYLLLFLAIIFLIIIYGYLETRRFVITKYNITSNDIPKELNNKKAILFSDLHDCTYGDHNKKIKEMITTENPDFILVAGDCFEADYESKDALELLSFLCNSYNVYCADGNHELKTRLFYPDYYDKYLATGIINLNNDNIKLYDNVYIYGLDIDISHYKRFMAPTLSNDELSKKLGKIDKNCYNILIAHNPLYMDLYSEYDFNLIVSGHYHGGFLRLPFFGGVITPQLKIFPKFSGGQYRHKHSDIIVSRGLGTHTFKIRINNTPELIVLNFIKDENK